MRCPKCKATLIYGGKRRYETSSEHVEDPNKEYYPLRDIYVCPNQCFEEGVFFNYEGAIYGCGVRIPSNCFFALDSLEREISIEVDLDGLSKCFRFYAFSLKGLIVKGEKDIPPRWKWLFYALKGKYLRARYRWQHRKDKQPIIEATTA